MKTSAKQPNELDPEPEGRTTGELAAGFDRREFDTGSGEAARYVSFPLIAGTKPAAPGEELTPERVANLLLAQEAEWADEAGRS